MVLDVGNGRESSPPPQINLYQVKPEKGPSKILIQPSSNDSKSDSSATPERKFSRTSSPVDEMYNVEEESPHQAKKERTELVRNGSLVIQN